MIFWYVILFYTIGTTIFYLYMINLIRKVADGDIIEFMDYLERCFGTKINAFKDLSEISDVSLDSIYWLLMIIIAICWPWCIFQSIKSKITN